MDTCKLLNENWTTCNRSQKHGCFPNNFAQYLSGIPLQSTNNEPIAMPVQVTKLSDVCFSVRKWHNIKFSSYDTLFRCKQRCSKWEEKLSPTFIACIYPFEVPAERYHEYLNTASEMMDHLCALALIDPPFIAVCE